ncbi:MAG: lasso peptide biosynthesis B2 protein [Erythrobacter sp.]
MSRAQSHRIPESGKELKPSDLVWFVPCFARAIYHLARARLKLRRVSPIAIKARNRALLEAFADNGIDAGSLEILLDRLSFTIPRTAGRMPWRADCLVQAFAAQDILASKSIGSAVVIGVKNDDCDGFAAHAWLECGSRTITGGEIQGYAELLHS